jgi:hypothetical protein
MKTFKPLLTVIVIAAMGAVLLAQADKSEPSGAKMASAAEKFLAAMSPAQKTQATFAFDDAERLNWHFIPRERKGIPLRDLDGAALSAAHDLLQTGLSKAGYDQALSVMSLEEVLYLLEAGDRATRRERRNPGKYYFSIFGTPSKSGRWGWRVEGHHLSLNYTIDNGDVIGSTPEFFGANPGVIDAGPGRSIRVLAPEEDIARQILKLCSADNAKVVLVETKAPDDLRGANQPQADVTPAVGLSAKQMNPDQRKLLGELLSEYLRNMPADVEAKRRARVEKDGLDSISFAWWGGSERNQPYYYRVQGPSFLIEHNNTQNNANHIHSFWRDLAGDFGIARK